MEYRQLLVEKRSGIVAVTLNRPEKLNAIGARMVHELLEVVEQTRDDDASKVLLITGAGRGFCAGADLSTSDDGEAESLDEQAGGRRMREGAIGRWGVLFSTLGHYSKPVIAAVNGVAAGGGLSLALAADIRIASSEARFISVFVRRALIPDTGTTFHLPQLIGRGRAIEMMLTGDTVDAERAECWGLVNRVVESDRLLGEARALADRIASGPSVALELTKRLVDDVTRRDLDVQLQNEAWALSVAGTSADREEGTRAFLEKRHPEWTGR